MKIIADLHTHTIASGHAYSTLKENIEEGIKKGLLAIGTSDHAPKMPGAPHLIFFENFKVIPNKIQDIHILKGVEANILDYKGSIDITTEVMAKMDYIIASLHTPCIAGGTTDENTQALIGVMNNPYVKVIGHPDDDRYPLDYDKLTRAASKMKVALELNNSSLLPLSTRLNGRINAEKMLKKCIENETMVIVGSDSHYCSDVGNFKEAIALIEKIQFPERLIVNTSMEKLTYVLNSPKFI